MRYTLKKISIFTALSSFTFLTIKCEFSFPDHSSSIRTAYYPSSSRSLSYTGNSYHRPKYNTANNDREAEARHFHKIKKLKKKLLLACLLGAGGGGNNRRGRSKDVIDGKFFLPPSVIQQTAVNVGAGSSGGDDSLNDDSGTGNIGGLNCENLIHFAPINHPLLGLLGGLGGGDGSSSSGGGDDGDETDGTNKLFYNTNVVNRHVIRPLYKSMKQFYNVYSIFK